MTCPLSERLSTSYSKAYNVTAPSAGRSSTISWLPVGKDQVKTALYVHDLVHALITHRGLFWKGEGS